MALMSVASCQDGTAPTIEESNIAGARIVLDSASIDLPEGVTRTVEAVVVDAEGRPIEGVDVSWTSADTEVATITADGRVTALQPGRVELTASALDMDEILKLLVRIAPMSLEYVDGNEQVGKPATALPVPTTVRVVDRRGDPLAQVPVVFIVTSGGGSTAASGTTTDANGVISAVWTLGPSGAQRMEAHARLPMFKEAMADSVVAFTATTQASEPSAPDVEAVAVSPATDTVPVSGEVSLRAVLRDAAGRILTDRPVTWSSADTRVAGVASDGTVSGLAAGATTIRATAEGVSGTGRVVVAAAPAPDPETPVAPARVNDLKGSASAGSVTLTWTAVSDGAGSGAQYAVRGGTPTITWGSAQGKASEQLVAAKAPGQVVSLTLTDVPANTDFQAQVVSYRGTMGEDAVMGQRSNIVSFNTSADDGGDNGGGEDPAVTAITASPSSQTFTEMGATRQITATARDAAGSVVSGVAFTWSSTNPSAVSVDGSGRITARAAGTAAIIVASVCCGASDTVSTSVDLNEPPPPSGGGDAWFSDSFDNGQKNNANGFSWVRGVDVTNERAHSGSHSLRFRYQDAGDHKWAEQRFDLGRNVEELWMEFWIYYPANYTHGSNGGSDNNKFFRLWGDDYDSQNKVGASTWPGSGGASRLRFDYVRSINQAVGPGESPSATWADGSMLGKWTRVRIHARHASSSQNDGVLQIWRDNSLVLNFQRVDQKYTGNPYWNAGYLLGYDNSGFQQETVIYIDDVKFWVGNPGW